MEHSRYLARTHIPALDGIRGLAVLAVISAHMHNPLLAWVSGARGLTWFFILSGYLITRLCLGEEKSHGKVSLRAFFTRRFFRVAPLYYAVIALYCVLIFGLGVSPGKRLGMIAGLPYYLTYWPEIPTVLGIVPAVVIPFGQSWSLGIEAKFYLLWPLLAFWLLARQAHARYVMAGTLFVILGAGPFFDVGLSGILMYAYWNVLVGCGLALLLNRRTTFRYLRPLGSVPWTLMLLLALVVLHFGIIEPTETVAMDRSTAAIRSLYTLLAAGVLTSVLIGDGWLQDALEFRPLLFVGQVSYGVYLLHRLSLNVAEVLVSSSLGRLEGAVEFLFTCLLAILAAYVAHVTIEAPAMAFGRHLATRLRRPKATLTPAFESRSGSRG